MASPVEVLRTCFATFTKRQQANVKANLDSGLVPLCGLQCRRYVSLDEWGHVNGA